MLGRVEPVGKLQGEAVDRERESAAVLLVQAARFEAIRGPLQNLIGAVETRPVDSGSWVMATLNVPEDSTLEISVASTIPDGYAPADGYDPLVVAAADVPLGGCGGENACPMIEMILVRTDGAIDGTTSLQILARNCNDAPIGSIFDQQEGCGPAGGAFFNVYDARGEFLGNCESVVDTPESGPSFLVFGECSVEVPYGSTGVVIEDPDSIPNYAPVRNPMSFFTLGSEAVRPESYVGPVLFNVLQEGAGDENGVTDLPNTGAGPASTGLDSVPLLTGLSAVAALIGLAGLRMRRQR